jgi:hypothetical protein
MTTADESVYLDAARALCEQWSYHETLNQE